MRIALAYPLDTRDGLIDAIVLRQPTARDLSDLGGELTVLERVPINGAPAIVLRPRRHLALAWLERLSDIPAGDLRRLGLPDGIAAMRAVCELVETFIRRRAN